MRIDHIFIFTNDRGQVADELVEFGLTEGSNRIHPGQGTTNRKFYFENFFLEILWVHNETEITGDATRPMGLGERANFARNSFSPFGLCLVNEESSDQLFEHSFRHQPQYFPPGMPIEIIKNEQQPSLPWTFRLPFKGHKKNESEPKDHKIGLSSLTLANFEYSGEATDEFLANFTLAQQISFTKSDRDWLTLTFDQANHQKSVDFNDMPLTIEY